MEKVSFSVDITGLSRCQDDPDTSEGMEELLLQSSEEETCSNQSPFTPGATGRTAVDQVKAYLMDRIRRVRWRNVRDFCKRNGLLTLSVIAVITGCTLGFMLRGTELSTQVQN